jgi:hypothetical protein
MTQLRLVFALIALATLTTAAHGQATLGAPKSSDTWAIIMLGEHRVGYSRTTSTPYSEGRHRLIRSTEETRLRVKRFGQSIEMMTRLKTIEEEDGTLRSFELQVTNPPAASSTTSGIVAGNRLKLTTLVAGNEQTQTISWDTTARAPLWQDRSLRQKPLHPGEKRTLRLFIPAFSKTSNVEITAGNRQKIRLHDGSTPELLRTTITQSILPAMPTTAWMDASGVTLRSEANFLGTKMITYQVTAEVALQEISGAELDIAVNTLVHLEKPIVKGHRSKKVVYRIRVPGEGVASIIPSSETQDVKSIDRETAEVTVTIAKPPTGKRHVRIDRRFLKATPFLQINDDRVKNHARRASAGETNTWRVCKQMEKYVHRELKSKNFSTALASAAEVAKTLEGDCTEHAILLAAMLRAERIASKVAVGVVYIESQGAFGGHMWTEAFVDGRWLSLDPTLGRGGIGAAHIKLAECDFSDDAPSPVTSFLPLFNLMGNMKIEVVSAE